MMQPCDGTDPICSDTSFKLGNNDDIVIDRFPITQDGQGSAKCTRGTNRDGELVSETVL